MLCITRLCNLGFLGYSKYDRSNKQLEKILDPSRAIEYNDVDVNSSSGGWDIILVEISSIFAGFILF